LNKNSRARGKGKEQIIIPLTITSRIRRPSYLRREKKYVTYGRNKGIKSSKSSQKKKQSITKNITIRI
jgi:hypothetical protein